MDNQVQTKDKGRIWGGLFLLGIGSLLLLDKIGFPFPFWLFKWPMILIAVGLFLGLRHGFRGPAWLILIAIGSVFLFDMIQPGYSLKRFTTPIVFIVIGLVLLVRPRIGSRFGRPRWRSGFQPEGTPLYPNEDQPSSNYAKDDYIDSVAFFGNIRKVVVSKDFKGGDMTAVFGGNEMDLSQADMTGPVVLDVTQIFGGTKLLVPATWEIKSEVVAIFGGIEDKRVAVAHNTTPPKLLILKGTTIFGGIQIRSY